MFCKIIFFKKNWGSGLVLLIQVQRYMSDLQWTTEQKEHYALSSYCPKLNFYSHWAIDLCSVYQAFSTKGLTSAWKEWMRWGWKKLKLYCAHESIVLSICPFQPSVLSTGVLFTYARQLWHMYSWELGPWSVDMLLHNIWCFLSLVCSFVCVVFLFLHCYNWVSLQKHCAFRGKGKVCIHLTLPRP